MSSKQRMIKLGAKSNVMQSNNYIAPLKSAKLSNSVSA